MLKTGGRELERLADRSIGVERAKLRHHRVRDLEPCQPRRRLQLGPVRLAQPILHPAGRIVEDLIAQPLHLGDEHFGGVERAIRILGDVQEVK